MRIAYLISKYPAANHTYLLREIAELRHCGFDIDVVAISPDERDFSELTAVERREREQTFVVKAAHWRTLITSHVRTLVCRPAAYARGLRAALALAGPDLRRVAYHVAYFAEAVVVGRWLEERAIDQMHVHYASTVGLLVAVMFPVDVSATVHGSAEFINPESQRIREKMARFICVVAISNYGRSQLMLNSAPVHWRKISVVPLGVDVTTYRRIERSRNLASPFRVTFVGQLQPAKGIYVLIDSLKLLISEGRSIHVTIVGDGSERQALEAYVDKVCMRASVTFAGRMNQDEVRDVYDRSDAFVLPSFAEGIPVVLMEAMASEIPCIATRITGIPELIRDGVDGLLVTPADVEQLAAGIARLIDDPALARGLAISAAHVVSQHFDIRTNVARLGEVLRRAQSERVGRSEREVSTVTFPRAEARSGCESGGVGPGSPG